MQVPPGQYHESPTEQYWNGLPNDQIPMGTGIIHPNANQFSQNCNINNNNMNTIGDYDGTNMDMGGGWL